MKRGKRIMYTIPIPLPPITMLSVQKPDEMKFKQGEFELIVNYYRKLTPEEQGLVSTTVCK